MTIVAGNFGGSPAPKKDLTFTAYLSKLEEPGITPNVAQLVGYIGISIQVKGENLGREANPKEVNEMMRYMSGRPCRAVPSAFRLLWTRRGCLRRDLWRADGGNRHLPQGLLLPPYRSPCQRLQDAVAPSRVSRRGRGQGHSLADR
jgi:hypothetical protein